MHRSTFFLLTTVRNLLLREFLATAVLSCFLYDMYHTQLAKMSFERTFHTWDKSSIPTARSRSFKADLLPDLYDLAHVTGWDPYSLHDLGHVSWVGSVLYRSCTSSHNGKLGSRLCRSWSVRRMELSISQLSFFFFKSMYLVSTSINNTLLPTPHYGCIVNAHRSEVLL